MAGRLSDHWEERGELRPLEGSVPPPVRGVGRGRSEEEKDISDK